jgi:hypothetical protein
MIRKLLVAALAAAVVAAPVEAKRAFIIYTPVQKLVRADAVVVGKVSAVEKDAVTATPVPGAPDKLSYKVAVIKVDSGLAGAANTTHVKVGFIPPAPGAPAVAPGRGGPSPVNLAEGTEGLFFLTRHHSGDFYTIAPLLAPTETKADDYKAQLEEARKAAAALADPIKALKSDKADDRFFAAYVLVNKYRLYPETGGEVETVKVPAAESALVLREIAAGNWKQDRSSGNPPNALEVFGQLGLTEKDGWKYPVVKPGEDFTAKTKEAFACRAHALALHLRSRQNQNGNQTGLRPVETSVLSPVASGGSPCRYAQCAACGCGPLCCSRCPPARRPRSRRGRSNWSAGFARTASWTWRWSTSRRSRASR